jgi:hypothetical protein
MSTIKVCGWRFFSANIFFFKNPGNRKCWDINYKKYFPEDQKLPQEHFPEFLEIKQLFTTVKFYFLTCNIFVILFVLQLPVTKNCQKKFPGIFWKHVVQPDDKK